MDALIFATVVVCLWPNEPQHKVCTAVTLKEPFATVELCEAGWVGAINRWAGPNPAAEFSAQIMGCGPASKGGPEDVPMPRMPQRHLLPPNMGPPTWQLQGQDI